MFQEMKRNITQIMERIKEAKYFHKIYYDSREKNIEAIK